MNGAGAEWKNTAKLAAEVNFFAGVKGGLEIKGAVEWRNPHNAKKDFEILASIAPQVQGMAGLAGQLKLAVEYVDGIFRVTAHAGLCFGLGAEGTVSLAVGAKQLGTFLYWLYYNLLHIGFKNAKFIAESAFEAYQQLTYLLICQGGNAIKSFGVALDDLRAAVISLEAEYQKAESCLKLAGNILANPESVRLSPPETKGMLIYQLTRHGKANWSKDGFGLLDSFLSTQRRAVLAVLRNTTIKSDLDNVIQHIHPKGQKVNFNTQMKMLGDFFALEGPGGLNVPGTKTSYEKDWEKIQRERGAHSSANKDLLAINGDFQAWYDLTRTSLRTEHIRGMPAVENSCLAYTLQGSRDHVLFSSAHYGFYGPKT
ncbi:hypothetical protein [Chitinimonas taiwanensis]|uniref:hypothetical protein n=1 Tax=Chitinimonas taiwanensis TaxID=240412 RepID=UPI0035B06E38